MYKHSFNRREHQRFQTDLKPRMRLMLGRFEDYLSDNKGKLDPSGVLLDEFAGWGANAATRYLLQNLNPTLLRNFAYIYGQFFWQFSKLELCIHDEIVDHIVQSDPPSRMPAEILRRLPYISQWIQAPIGIDVSEFPSEKELHEKQPTFYFPGAFVSYYRLDCGRRVMSMTCSVLCGAAQLVDPENAMYASVMVYVDEDFNSSGTGQMSAAMVNINRSIKDKSTIAIIDGAVERWAKQMLSCILFVCSQEDTLLKGGATGHRSTKTNPNSYKLAIAAKPRSIVVGQEFVEEVKKFEREQADSVSFSGRRAHMRRGHYHNFWTGPKAGPRRLVCKWLPPTVVRGTLAD